MNIEAIKSIIIEGQVISILTLKIFEASSLKNFAEAESSRPVVG